MAGLGVKLMEINSNLFSRHEDFGVEAVKLYILSDPVSFQWVFGLVKKFFTNNSGTGIRGVCGFEQYEFRQLGSSELKSSLV